MSSLLLMSLLLLMSILLLLIDSLFKIFVKFFNDESIDFTASFSLEIIMSTIDATQIPNAQIKFGVDY